MITSGFWGVLAAARSGDEDAFGALWRAANPGLMRYLRVVAPAHADVVAAATWSAAIRELGRFRGDPARWQLFVLGTARRCARRATSTRFRDPRRRAPGTRALPDVVTDVALRLLAALPAPEGEVLVLRTACGLSATEAAELARLTPAAVQASTHRGLARAGALVASPDLLRRIDARESRTEPADWVALAALPDPRVAETVFDHLLAGGTVPPGASRRWRELADLVAALTAPATSDELAGLPAALAVYRRRFATRPRHAHVSIRLGSRVAVAAAAAGLALPGALTAAYAGVLPDWLQSVAHEWLDAPQPPVHDRSVAPTDGRKAPSGPVGTAGRASHTGQPHPTAVPHSAAPHPTRAVPATSKTPPGSTKTPPGSTRTPGPATPSPTTPNPKRTPPGSTKTPPGSTRTPPTTTRTPPRGAPSTATRGARSAGRSSPPAQSS